MEISFPLVRYSILQFMWMDLFIQSIPSAVFTHRGIVAHATHSKNVSPSIPEMMFRRLYRQLSVVFENITRSTIFELNRLAQQD